MLRAGQRADELRHIACRHIAHHDRPDVGRVAALVAAADHAEHAAERRGVPLRADQHVVQHDKQAVDAEVQDRRAGAVFRAVVDVVAGVAQELPVFLSAAHSQAPDDRKAKDHAAEDEAQHREAVAKTHALRRRRRGQEDLVQQRPQEERDQADGDGRVVEVIALVHARAVRQNGREDEANEDADGQRQQNAVEREAGGRRGIQRRIVEQHLGDQRGQTRGEQEGVGHRAGLFFHDEAVDQHTGEREPDVEDRRAPEAEACRQEERQDGYAVRLAAGQAVEPETDRADQRDIQKCAGKTAVAGVKIAFDCLAGLCADAHEPIQHPAAVRHEHGREQADHGKAREQPADHGLGGLKLLFHSIHAPFKL